MRPSGLSSKPSQYRNIKPDNIIFSGRGLPKTMDFGLANLKGATKVTKTGRTVGTLQYTSSEQASGAEVDGRSDIFSCEMVADLLHEKRLLEMGASKISQVRPARSTPRKRVLLLFCRGPPTERSSQLSVESGVCRDGTDRDYLGLRVQTWGLYHAAGNARREMRGGCTESSYLDSTRSSKCLFITSDASSTSSVARISAPFRRSSIYTWTPLRLALRSKFPIVPSIAQIPFSCSSA
jgi:serine/threonine protein kinase